MIVDNWISKTKWLPRSYDKEQLEKMIAQAIPRREVWLVGTPAEGYISLNIKTFQVTGLYVSNPGNGLGKKLLDKIKTNRKYLRLWSHSFNKRAHKFYLREGFKITGKKEKGDDGIPEILFEWVYPTKFK
tara:strand:+ start:107 stop:496 length:390 start_codon:yes stop_codon:yes gene_type:complete